jgi:hypothetical protein
MKNRNVAIVHYNTPELTEAAIWSLRKHGGEDYKVYVFDNSDVRPFTKKMKGVKVIDNTKGHIIDFDAELAKYPNRNREAGECNHYGSDKHMMSVQKLWDLIPDGFVLMDSDILIKEDISWMFWEGECCCGYVSTTSYKGVPRLMPMLLWINVPMCKAGGARFFDPDRSWALHPGDDPRNYWDTGAAFYDDIRRLKPKCHGKSITRDRILQAMVHYQGGSWRQTDLTHQQAWLERYSELWKPTPRMQGIKDVAICAIGRNENRYAVDFVEHYMKMGVKKIYLYDNGFGDEERLSEVVNDKKVEIIDWRDRKNQQCAAYEDCYQKHGDEYAWIGFFDFDELLNICTKRNLPKLMDAYSHADAVLVNWKIIKDDGKPMEPTKCVKYDFPEDNHIKAFVRGGIKGLRWGATPHVPTAPALHCVNNRGVDVAQKPFTPYDFNVMWLDHYTTRSADEFVQKVRRGFPCGEAYTIGYRQKAVEYFFKINERTKEKEKILEKL